MGIDYGRTGVRLRGSNASPDNDYDYDYDHDYDYDYDHDYEYDYDYDYEHEHDAVNGYGQWRRARCVSRLFGPHWP